RSAKDGSEGAPAEGDEQALGPRVLYRQDWRIEDLEGGRAARLVHARHLVHLHEEQEHGLLRLHLAQPLRQLDLQSWHRPSDPKDPPTPPPPPSPPPGPTPPSPP